MKNAFAALAWGQFAFTERMSLTALKDLLAWEAQYKHYFPLDGVAMFLLAGPGSSHVNDVPDLIDLTGRRSQIPRLYDHFQFYRVQEGVIPAIRNLIELYKANPDKRGALPVLLHLILGTESRALDFVHNLPTSCTEAKSGDEPVIAFAARGLALASGRVSDVDFPAALQSLIDLEIAEPTGTPAIVAHVIDLALRRRSYDLASRIALTNKISQLMGDKQAEVLIAILRSALDARHTDLDKSDFWSELGLPLPLFEMLSQASSDSKSDRAVALRN